MMMAFFVIVLLPLENHKVRPTLCIHKSLFTLIHKDTCRHMGFEKVFAGLWKNYFWIGMANDIKEWLKACSVSQKTKPGTGRMGMKIKHENVTAPGQRAAMDLAIMPLTPDGYRYLLVYQDYYSKFIELIPLKEKTPKAMASQGDIYSS